MERICVHSPTNTLWNHSPSRAPTLQSASWVSRSPTTPEMSMPASEMMTPADWLTTFCATSNTAMTMFQVLVTISTAQKVLKIHLKKIQVSKSWRLFFSMMSWISS